MVDLSYSRMLIMRVGQGFVHDGSVLRKEVDHDGDLFELGYTGGTEFYEVAPHPHTSNTASKVKFFYPELCTESTKTLGPRV